MRRIGILGGSFDPVHYGHLLLAESCQQQCDLDEVWFVPAAMNPHKPAGSHASDAQRVEMLQLAVAGHSGFSILEMELERGGASFTVDTLELLHEQFMDHEFFLLLGADSLADLPAWKDPRRICELAVLSVVRRLGCPPVDLDVLAEIVTPEQLQQIRISEVEMPGMELTSTGIRERVRDSKSIRFRTPRAVEMYIETTGLYRDA
ncbi:MAG: nicotinate (nicotinamide) nucleotide adenylyltransferase [Planctomycetaceae bacterium]|nr:nicotinate (nicotinamide) nucleotide adenylyltransferase [Planctomycetaceae bacterium]